MKTSSMGMILSIKGDTAKTINFEMKDPQINKNVIHECAKIASQVIFKR